MDGRWNDINRREYYHTKIQTSNKKRGEIPIIGFGIERMGYISSN